MNKEITPLQLWYLIKEYLNIYHHQAIKENIDVETVEGYPISIIETALKALEIIKNKHINCIDIITTKDYEEYIDEFNRFVKGNNPLNREEYDLLKEILK